jgi:hypothetical protein
MKRTVQIAARFGFLVRIALGVQMLFLFNAPDSGWVHFVCYQLPYIVCPGWALGNGSGFWMVAMPLINALTYGALAFLIVNAKQRSAT